MRIRVEQVESESSGCPVANQFIIRSDDGVRFQSYNTVIAFRPCAGPVQLDRQSWDYSVTTGRYRNQFLGEKKAATERKIKSGEYVLTDLNA